MMPLIPRLPVIAALGLVLATLAGCGFSGRHSEQECMERAMFFESHRSSRDGMIAVGSALLRGVITRKAGPGVDFR